MRFGLCLCGLWLKDDKIMLGLADTHEKRVRLLRRPPCTSSTSEASFRVYLLSRTPVAHTSYMMTGFQWLRISLEIYFLHNILTRHTLPDG